MIQMKFKVKKFGKGGAHIIISAKYIGQELNVDILDEKSTTGGEIISGIK